MAKLSILIPARNEIYLNKTIEDLLTKIEGDTNIFIGLDEWDGNVHALPSPKGDRIFYHGHRKLFGQRAITNELARLSDSQYLMKIDGHVSFSKGFDVKMMAEMDDRTILAPLLLPLYGDSWTINGKKQMCQFEFGRDFVMQHKDGEPGETMCLQGSAWMITKENYFKWNVCDESLGSWGGQAVELGIAAYLNGGRCVTTREAYYGHVFRHTDDEFPYDRGENPGKFATEELKRRYENHEMVLELFEKYNK